MTKYEIKHRLSGEILFAGEAGSLKLAVEIAVSQDADLRYADLSSADLDFSCLPLWCGSFNMKVSTRFVWQLIAHISRLDTSNVSKKARVALKLIRPFANEFCRYRKDVEKI